MNWNFTEIRANARTEILGASDLKELEAVRIKYLGSKGLLKEVYASFATIAPEQKAAVGKDANDFKVEFTEAFDRKRKELEEKESSLKAPEVDVTLPGVAPFIGRPHLLTQVIDEICRTFEGLGFAVHEGPEIETEFNNFSALNIPVDHPSRDAFDTFYLKAKDPDNKERNLLLRSHTSPGQIRIMQRFKPPLAVVIPGKVYRPDAVDASHSFMFHQIEGLLVDKRVRFSDLKGLLTEFCKRFFGEDIDMRFRPHFFPFTEPSAEVDIRWEHGRKEWLEILGCGMVHPKVFEAVGYPKGAYTGLAFGMGIERIAMLKYGIRDIRTFFENDVRFLEQF